MQDVINKPLKIFISYSKDDHALLQRFNQHLSFLVRIGLIQTWKDTDLLSGSDWHSEIRKNLSDAEIIVFLVSASLLANDYVYQVEMREAQERQIKGEAIVIPIIIRHCCWEDTFFNDIQVLPRKAVPITSFEDQDLAWTQVVRDMKTLVYGFASHTQNAKHNK
jgi:internalin A